MIQIYIFLFLVKKLFIIIYNVILYIMDILLIFKNIKKKIKVKDFF